MKVWALVLCASSLFAVPAHAATVATDRATAVDSRQQPIPFQTITVTAVAGEVNRLEIVAANDGTVRLTDPAGLTTTAPCLAQDAQSVTCPPGGDASLGVTLGDGDDTLHATGAISGEADGGAGDDDLSGANLRLEGGLGDDTLAGVLVEGGPGADTLSGGLSYADHTVGVTLDLAGGIGGAPGENDHLAPGARVVVGGAGDDVIPRRR